MNCKHESTAGNTLNRGYTLIELVLVMALLALFGVATFSLVISGSTAYKGIMEKKDSESELRVAISYLDTKVRQNDFKNAVRLKENPAGDGKALVVEETVEGIVYETWIYLSGGKLREVLVETGEPVQDNLGFEIATIEGFNVAYDSEKKLLDTKVWNTTQKGRQELETDIAVKSGITAGE